MEAAVLSSIVQDVQGFEALAKMHHSWGHSRARWGTADCDRALAEKELSSVGHSLVVLKK